MARETEVAVGTQRVYELLGEWHRHIEAFPTHKRVRPNGDVFSMVKAFFAGVMLATGFIHILPHSFQQLSSPCLEGAWNDFPFAGFVAMVAAIATLMIESTATGYYRRVHFREGETMAVVEAEGDVEHAGHVHMHTHATHGHAHGDGTVAPEAAGRMDLIRRQDITRACTLGAGRRRRLSRLREANL